MSFPPFNKNDLSNKDCNHQDEKHLSMHRFMPFVCLVYCFMSNPKETAVFIIFELFNHTFSEPRHTCVSLSLDPVLQHDDHHAIPSERKRWKPIKELVWHVNNTIGSSRSMLTDFKRLSSSIAYRMTLMMHTSARRACDVFHLTRKR